MSTIKTLSVPAYIARLNKGGYSAAICFPDIDCYAPTKVLQQFSDGTDYGMDTAWVNVQTGVITSPAYLRGLWIMQQASELSQHVDPVTRAPLYVFLTDAEEADFSDKLLAARNF